MDVTKTPGVPYLPITVEEIELEEGARKVVEKLRPQWNLKELEFKLLTDGITNKLIQCKLKGTDDRTSVLVRVYGNKTDLLIDRKAETKNIILLNFHGLAPKLYGTFKNGLAYQFIHGSTLTSSTVILPKIYRLVAKKMAQFHKVKIEGETPQPMLWQKLDHFISLVPDVFTDDNKHERYVRNVTPKSKIKNEVIYLKDILSNLGSPVVFAHNDLLLGNVIYTEDEGCVSFIDYEYAAFNYQAFDIGNHFAEFVGISGVDYSNFPKRELQLDWLKTYLQEFKGQEVSQDEVEKLYVQVNKFVLMSHIFWGVWALIQAEYSSIDFDFMGYAEIRLNEYYAKKEKFLSLK